MTTYTIAGIADWIGADGNPLYFFYEQLADVCTRCSDVMVLFAFVLAFAGLMLQVYKGIIGGDLSGIFKNLLMTGIIVVIMPYYAEWMLEAQHVLGEDLLVELEVDPISMLEGFGEEFSEPPFETSSAPSIVFGIIDPLTWAEYFAQIVGAFLMMLLSIFMWVCFYVGFQIQIVAIYLGCAAGPLFLAMLLFEPTRDTAVKYHVGMIGICFWPLGWGLGMLFGEAMMEGGLALVGAILYLAVFAMPFATVVAAAGMIIIELIVIVWFIVTLFAAPKIVQKAVTTGAQIGMGLVNAGISTSTSVATAGVQAASGAAMMAGGAAVTAATGGAGAAVGVGMMGAGAGSMGGAAGSMAGAVTKAGD